MIATSFSKKASNLRDQAAKLMLVFLFNFIWLSYSSFIGNHCVFIGNHWKSITTFVSFAVHWDEYMATYGGSTTVPKMKNLFNSAENENFAQGGSRIFFEGGGGGFSKRNRKFWRLFFLGRPNWFFEPSQSTVLPLCWQNFLRRVFRHFLENFDQKNCVFSARAPPSKLVNNGAEGDFRKILGSVGQKWIS